MTTGEHHPPHDHPDFDTYLNSLTDDDHTAIQAATNTALNSEPNTRNDF